MYERIKVKYYFIAEIERMPEGIEIGFVFPQQEEKLSEIGRRQLTLFAEHNRSSDLSDILEEEEEDELSSEALEEKKWDSREPFYRENGEKVTCSRVMLVGSASAAIPCHQLTGEGAGLVPAWLSSCMLCFYSQHCL